MQSKQYDIQQVNLPRIAQTTNTIKGLEYLTFFSDPSLNLTKYAKINTYFLTFNEAMQACKLKSPPDSSNIQGIYCLEDKMHIANILGWYQEVTEQCNKYKPCINSVLSSQKQSTINYLPISYSLIDLEKKSFNSNISVIPIINVAGKKAFSQTYSLTKPLENIYQIRYQLLAKTSIDNSTIGKVKSDFIYVAFPQEYFPKSTSKLSTRFFNQYLEPNGKKFPSDGWQMCGAASAVIVSDFYNKIDYDKSDEHNLKQFMYSDKSIDKNRIACGKNKGGAFGITNYKCTSNYAGGIQNYLSYHNLKSTFTRDFDFEMVKKAIKNKHPVIMAYTSSKDRKFGHIVTIVGYTDKNQVIVQDTYTDIQKFGRGWKEYNTGKEVLYDFNSKDWPFTYFIEIYP